MAATYEEQAQFLDTEAGFSSDELPAPRARVLTPKRLLALAAGAVGLVGCGYVMTRPSAEEVQREEHVSARALLEHPDFLDAASNNVLTLGRGLLDDKSELLRPAAAKVMKRVSEMMEEHDPEGTKYLESVKLSPKHRSSVISVVKAMGDKRVQDMGHEVLQIAYDHKDEKDGFKTAAESVQRSLASRASELEELKRAVMPAELQEPVATTGRRLPGQASDKKCEGDTSKCNPGSELTSEMGKGMNMKLEDAMGIVGGLLEQARLALDESAVIGSSFGSPNHVDWFVRSLVGGAAFGVETMDCFMRQDDQHKLVDGKETLVNANSGEVNSVKMAMCPMKYAGAAMDLLSGANNVANIQNNRLPADFQLMFGGMMGQPAAPQANFNPYAHAAAAASAFTNPLSTFMGGMAPMTTTVHPFMQAANAMQNAAQMHQMATAGHALAQHAFAYTGTR